MFATLLEQYLYFVFRNPKPVCKVARGFMFATLFEQYLYFVFRNPHDLFLWCKSRFTG